MRLVTLQQPKRIVFGPASAPLAVGEITAAGAKRVLVVTSPPIVSVAKHFFEAASAEDLDVVIHDAIDREPTVAMFHRAVKHAKMTKPQAVVGIGGGSALDTAKLVAALWDSNQDVADTFGSGKLTGRKTPLICLPTTSGTGSEVSPNALLIDEADGRKKAVVSPRLIPDVAVVDAMLTFNLPPDITAATGMDAMVHCIEAVANVHAHPAVDVYALEGIRLIAANLAIAVEGSRQFAAARIALSLASMYGGLCLGPVNTAAVHALAYPLGEMFHLPHGLTNAVLLAAVMEFNLSAAPQRYARIAVALGAKAARSDLKTAQRGVKVVRDLTTRCGLPARLRDLGIPADALGRMAEAAMKVTRLLANNPRPVTQADAEAIYRKVY